MKLPAFQSLVDAHWRDVARLAHALAGPSDGDDVAQQAWAKALAAYPQLRSATNLRGWLLTITAHCALDSRRASARSPVLVADLSMIDATGPPSWGPHAASGPHDAGWVPHDAGDPLWVAVRQLPERQQAAIALRYIADLDHAQIGQALGTTSGASRRLVSDALGTLRSGLGAAMGAAGTAGAEGTPVRTSLEDHS